MLRVYDCNTVIPARSWHCRLRSNVVPSGHLLTTLQANTTAPGILSFVFRLWVSTSGTRYSVGATWPGDASNASDVGWGQWRWVDGTDSTSLNCNAAGCGIWGRCVGQWSSKVARKSTNVAHSIFVVGDTVSRL